MAQNTTEDTKSPVDKTEVSETLMCTTDKAVPCEGKAEVTDAAKAESTCQEANKGEVKNMNSLDTKEQADTSETDGSNSNKDTNPEEEPSFKKSVAAETKEDKVEEKCSETSSNGAGERVNAFSSEAEERLNEILKVVHDELDIKYFQKSVSQSTVAKSNNEDDNSKEQKTTKTTAAAEEEITENAKEHTDITAVQSPEEKKEDDARESSDKTDEKSEVGIVGPPTAVNELINEEELGGGDSASSTDRKDHVAEWVEKSGKVDTLIPRNVEDEDNVIEEREGYKGEDSEPEAKRKKINDDAPSIPSRKSQKIVSNIIKKSIKCLNRMHAMEGAFGGNGRNVDATANSPGTTMKVPQSQQNGVALPEETTASLATLDSQSKTIVKQSQRGVKMTKKNVSIAGKSQQSIKPRLDKSETIVVGKKRKSPSAEHSAANGSKVKKVCCLETREKCIRAIVGEEKTVDDLEAKVNKLQYEMRLLEKLAQDKEREWNNILRVRKMTEEAYLRLQRRKQMMKLANHSGAQLEDVQPTSFDLKLDNIDEASKESISKERCSEIKSDILDEDTQNASAIIKKQSVVKVPSQRRTTSPKTSGGNARKLNEMSSSDARQISEGRQGARVDVSTIIANYRKKHPEDVPRRGRRMRNTVNVGLVAGGAMVETGHSADSRPSSTDSSPSTVECQNTMNFREMVLQLNKMNQHQGEPTKTPQNYPDVTLHPVPSSPASQNTAPQQSGSLLHGILTKAQSPRPTTFSPTLARLLTAPERERNSPVAAAAAAAASMPQQSTATQHLLQTYQGSNLGCISELLSSSKARTEITITPVVNTPAQSHSNNVIHVDDVEEDNAAIDDRDSKYSVGRDVRDDRDNPPRCQGCHQRPAQFVCAGCANQWYCSRECQVASWDEHSEICSG